jgi:hypothetical protein
MPAFTYFTKGVPLEVRAKGNDSSEPIAISRAMRLAFRQPSVKGKTPAYIKMLVEVSRWVLDEDMPVSKNSRAGVGCLTVSVFRNKVKNECGL